MFKNLEYKDTYCIPDSGNIRYKSNARKSVEGWAYVYTQDKEYVNDLAINHFVQVRCKKGWIQYSGYLPTSDEIEEFNYFFPLDNI